ncbi:MAG: methyltransferase domain-containing protein [Hyphomicrobiaceae bacterium]
MWRIKLFLQFFLSKVPGGEKLNYLLQNARGVYSERYLAERLMKIATRLKVLNGVVPLKGLSIMEVGTGWSAINPIMLYLMGARTIHTYDHVAHLRHESVVSVLAAAKSIAPRLAAEAGLPESELRERIGQLEGTSSLDEFLRKAGITYHAPADGSVSGLPDSSVDLVYSYAVLEHVPKDALKKIVLESKRILKPDGAAYHRIEFHDHFMSFDKKLPAMHFLKYSEPFWSFFVYNNMGYQNRLREKFYIELFRSCGGEIILRDPVLRPEDLEYVKSIKVDKQFAGMTPEELAVIVSDIVTKFPRAA